MQKTGCVWLGGMAGTPGVVIGRVSAVETKFFVLLGNSESTWKSFIIVCKCRTPPASEHSVAATTSILADSTGAHDDRLEFIEGFTGHR
jgi:hypothetical protein